MSLNKSILIGRLTKEVEMQQVNENSVKAKFTLAVDRNYKPKGKDKPETDFINVVAWGSSAKFAEKYFHKGKQVYVVGSIETYSYEKDGVRRGGFDVKADDVGFADTMKSSADNTDNSGFDTIQTSSGFADNTFGQFPTDFGEMGAGDFDDDLPFNSNHR